jgi:hypothetical protein
MKIKEIIKQKNTICNLISSQILLENYIVNLFNEFDIKIINENYDIISFGVVDLFLSFNTKNSIIKFNNKILLSFVLIQK